MAATLWDKSTGGVFRYSDRDDSWFIRWFNLYTSWRVRRGSFKVRDTCTYSWGWVGNFSAKQGGRRNKQSLQSRETRLGIRNGMGFSKNPALHSHTSLTRIGWKCHQLPHLWHLGLSYPLRPASSLISAYWTISWIWKSDSNCFSLLSHPTPLWSISPLCSDSTLYLQF